MKNPIYEQLQSLQIEKIIQNFSGLSKLDEYYILSFWKYIDKKPEKYFCRKTFHSYLLNLQKFKKTNEAQLLHFLHKDYSNLNNAFRHLNEICDLNWHDKTLNDYDEWRKLLFIEQELHPAYLRLLEGVYKPLLRLMAAFSRVNRSKGTDGLDLHQIVEELKFTNFSSLRRFSPGVMRNGLGHGGVEYSDNAIIYRDQKGNETKLNTNEVIQLFDDLLDICNGLLFGFSVFLFQQNNIRYKIPNNLLTEVLKASTKSSWWNIKGCLESQALQGNQLNIYVDGDSIDPKKMHFSMLQTGLLAEKLRPGYDRYFIRIKSNLSLLSFAAFNGKRLSEQRSSNIKFPEYRGIVDDNMFFYSPKRKISKPFAFLHTLFISCKVNWPLIINEFRGKLRQHKITVRHVNYHRNSWGMVLNAKVIIEIYGQNNEIDKENIKTLANTIIKKAKKLAKKELSFFSLLNYLPIGYSRVHVYQKDYRKRKLYSFGLGEDLICTIQTKRISRIKSPDISGSTIEQFGKFRIAWNKEWLENCSIINNEL